MIDGEKFIRKNYARISNSNDPEVYKQLYHPDILWCPPDLEDKRGVNLVAFCYGMKGYHIHIELIETEGLPGTEHSYVTGLVKVDTFTPSGEFIEQVILRGCWLVVEYENRLCIRYQVWNQK